MLNPESSGGVLGEGGWFLLRRVSIRILGVVMLAAEVFSWKGHWSGFMRFGLISSRSWVLSLNCVGLGWLW